ncbi:MAG: alpha/beta hydrolase [Pseudomonadota bacterium]
MPGGLKLLLALAAAYSAIVLLFWSQQERLLFYPRANATAATQYLTPFVWQTQDASGRRTGWFIPADEPQRYPLTIYFGGNAEDVARTAVTGLPMRQVLFVNYAGYGDSSGAPSEAQLLADALQVYDAAATALPHNGQILAMGRSLGSGVATFLATQRPIAGVVLVTPYDSIAAVAKGHYPWLPIDALLRHRFDSAARAAGLAMPALILSAGRDTVVPPAHAEALAAAWAGPVDRQHFDAADHGNISIQPGYAEAIQAFEARYVTPSLAAALGAVPTGQFHGQFIHLGLADPADLRR